MSLPKSLNSFRLSPNILLHIFCRPAWLFLHPHFAPALATGQSQRRCPSPTTQEIATFRHCRRVDAKTLSVVRPSRTSLPSTSSQTQFAPLPAARPRDTNDGEGDRDRPSNPAAGLLRWPPVRPKHTSTNHILTTTNGRARVAKRLQISQGRHQVYVAPDVGSWL